MLRTSHSPDWEDSSHRCPLASSPESFSEIGPALGVLVDVAAIKEEREDGVDRTCCVLVSFSRATLIHTPPSTRSGLGGTSPHTALVTIDTDSSCGDIEHYYYTSTHCPLHQSSMKKLA